MRAEMSELTEKGRFEQMWGWIPTLGKLLSGKKIPDNYFGYSSVDDNAFDSIKRLMMISILIQENSDEIKNQVTLQPELKEQLFRELNNVVGALESAARNFNDESERISKIVRHAL